MAGLQRPDQPVQEPPPPRSRLLEQPVHLRRQPNRGRHLGDLRLVARRRAADPEHPPVHGPSGGVPVATSRRQPIPLEMPDHAPRMRPVRAPPRQTPPIRAPRSPRPGTSSDTASSRLVLPDPFGPVITETAPPAAR